MLILASYSYICALLLQVATSDHLLLNKNACSFSANGPLTLLQTSVDRSIIPQLAPVPAKPADNANPQARQKALLIEEEHGTLKSARHSGSVVWRVEGITVSRERSPETTVRADIEIPSRRLGMRFSLARSEDASLAGSHTISIIFTLPEDISPAGGISSVPGVLMQQGETTPGIPLAGHSTKVSTNFFLVNLISTGTEFRKNLQLLKERPWLVVPFVYPDGTRAIVLIEKGPSGERAFSDAFETWGYRAR